MTIHGSFISAINVAHSTLIEHLFMLSKSQNVHVTDYIREGKYVEAFGHNLGCLDKLGSCFCESIESSEENKDVFTINNSLFSKRFVRVYSPQKWDNCPLKMPIMVNLTIPKMNYVQVKYAGVVSVTEEVKGELEMVIEGFKCSLDMTDCQKYNSFNVGGMCQKFQNTNAFYSSFFNSIRPPWKCPIKPGNYTIEEGLFDLNLISLLSLDGYVWSATFKFVSGDKRSKNKKIVMCLNSETKIIKTNKKN